METFINAAVTTGIKNYVLMTRHEQYSKAHIFEVHVIDMLSHIYSEINVINPYKLQSEKSFINNLRIFGLSQKKVMALFKSMQDYYYWLTSKNKNSCNSVGQIKIILLEMVLLKAGDKGLSEQEIKYYKKFFSNELFGMQEVEMLTKNDSVSFDRVWDLKKIYIVGHDKLTFERIAPMLLTEDKYKEFGIELNDVTKLSNQAIERINEKIATEDKLISKKKIGFNIPLKLAISSGNGFVDTLVLLSVIATEIMIGLLIAVTIARG